MVEWLQGFEQVIQLFEVFRGSWVGEPVRQSRQWSTTDNQPGERLVRGKEWCCGRGSVWFLGRGVLCWVSFVLCLSVEVVVDRGEGGWAGRIFMKSWTLSYLRNKNQSQRAEAGPVLLFLCHYLFTPLYQINVNYSFGKVIVETDEMRITVMDSWDRVAQWWDALWRWWKMWTPQAGDVGVCW